MTKLEKIDFIQKLVTVLDKKYMPFGESSLDSDAVNALIDQYMSDHPGITASDVNILIQQYMDEHPGIDANDVNSIIEQYMTDHPIDSGIVINSSPSYIDSRVIYKGVAQQMLDDAINNRIVEISPKYQPTQFIYTPAPDAVLPLRIKGEYDNFTSILTNSIGYSDILYNDILKYLYVTDGNYVRIYNIADYSLVQTLPVEGHPRDVSLTANGKRLLISSKAYIERDGQYEVEGDISLYGGESIEYIDSTGKAGICVTSSGYGKKWIINDLGEFHTTDSVNFPRFSNLSITPDGLYIASVVSDSDVHIYKKSTDGTYSEDSTILKADLDLTDVDTFGKYIHISIDGTKIFIGSRSGHVITLNKLVDNSWEQKQTMRPSTTYDDLSGIVTTWDGSKLFLSYYVSKEILEAPLINATPPIIPADQVVEVVEGDYSN